MRNNQVKAVPTGSTLVSVKYELFVWESLDEPPTGTDSVSTAVTMKFGEIQLRFRWEIFNGLEALTTDPPGPNSPTAKGTISDVSERWSRFLGVPLRRQTIALQGSFGGEVPWACRFDFENNQSLVIGLSEILEGGHISYVPDNLLVSSKEDLSRYFSNSIETN